MFFQAIKKQGAVLSGLFYREIRTRFGSSRLGILWLVFEPVAHIASLIVLWNLTGHLAPQSVNPYLFLATGVIPFLFFRTSVFRLIKSINANKALLIFPQINMLDFIITRLFIEIVGFYFVFAVVLLLISFSGLAEVVIKDMFSFLIACFMLFFSALSVGVFFLVLNSIYPVTEALLKAVFRILYFMSGIMFSIEKVPTEYREYFLYNPIFHIINLFRESFFKEYEYDPERMNYYFITSFFSIMFLIGVYMLKKYKKFILEPND